MKPCLLASCMKAKSLSPVQLVKPDIASGEAIMTQFSALYQQLLQVGNNKICMMCNGLLPNPITAIS